jgi:hypothetical protein
VGTYKILIRVADATSEIENATVLAAGTFLRLEDEPREGARVSYRAKEWEIEVVDTGTVPPTLWLRRPA